MPRLTQFPAGRNPLLFLAGFAIVLTLLFWRPLASLVSLVSKSEQHSHIALVPFISAYLIYDRRRMLPGEFRCSPAGTIALLLAGATTLGLALHANGQAEFQDDALAWSVLSFLCFLTSGAFFFLGRNWVAAAAFPIVFLLFMVPFPDHVTNWLETGSKLASAEAANMLFSISGTPVLRNNVIFQLPNITIQVAQECSGIRSSLVLLITSFLAGQLFLKSPWRRAILVALVIPLGILRNGFRIVTIGLLAVHIGPHMIDSPIHHRGGPLFFALSLIPFSLLLWWLRRGEQKRQPKLGPVPEDKGLAAS